MDAAVAGNTAAAEMEMDRKTDAAVADTAGTVALGSETAARAVVAAVALLGRVAAVAVASLDKAEVAGAAVGGIEQDMAADIVVELAALDLRRTRLAAVWVHSAMVQS
ncbi:hypothetical protein BGZ54_001596 [Gamsiella multidivaricata]|nr:hypothetical protein BGZ54_001596 [Gamsiella multidivaricata]